MTASRALRAFRAGCVCGVDVGGGWGGDQSFNHLHLDPYAVGEGERGGKREREFHSFAYTWTSVSKTGQFCSSLKSDDVHPVSSAIHS